MEDDYNYQITEDIKENYRKTIYQTTIWQSAVFIAYSGVLYQNRKEFMELIEDSANCYYFICINQFLYLFGVIYNITAFVLARYYTYFIKFSYVFTGTLVLFTIWGLTLAN